MQRFVVPSGVLRAKPKEAVRLMRLGALANAILSVASMSAGTMARGVGERRDTLQTVLVLASYFNEAIETIDHRRCWELIEAGVNAGYALAKPLTDARRAFSRSKGSFYKTALYEVRRTKGFHVDEKHFNQWLDSLRAPEVTLWRKASRAPLDWAFTASADIQEHYGKELTEAHMVMLQDAMLLPSLVEAMAGGLLAEIGIRPVGGLRSTSQHIVRLEMLFNDGRADFCMPVVATVDDNGDLAGSITDLRNFVNHIFGGPAVGVALPGNGCDIEFSSQRGVARGWLGPQLAHEISADRRALGAMRFRQMARWGLQRTGQVLRYLDAVRTGTAAAADAENLTMEFRNDIEFWRDRIRETEAIGNPHNE